MHKNSRFDSGGAGAVVEFYFAVSGCAVIIFIVRAAAMRL
jgi:hypothetical protein